MKKKKEPTTDAVEILRRCYGNNLWRKFCRWWYRQMLREEEETYNDGHIDGYKEGYDKGRLSFNRIAIQVTSLIMRVDRLDKRVEELKTKGAGAERENLAQ